MPSLSLLLASHRSLLVVDTASACVQVGLLRPSAPALWRKTTDEAGAALFAETAALLSSAQLTLDQVGAWVFCEGPGSMLGIRTAAMALRTWQTLKTSPVYSYQSLTLAAHHAARTSHQGQAFAMIADARRDSWHCLAVTASGELGSLQRLPTGELPTAFPLLTPENFRSWSRPPAALATNSYDLAAIFPTLGNAACFEPAESPDAFQHAAPDYKKWSAQIHQAPTATA